MSSAALVIPSDVLAAHDEAAPDDRSRRFEAEAMPHLRTLFGTAYRLTGNRSDAEDLVQETFLRAFRSFHLYTPGTNVKAWLYTILHRARTDGLRRTMRSPVTVPLPETEPGTASPEGRCTDGVDIETALAAVPETFRVPVVLRDVEGLTYDEIARALQIPIGTVMSRIHRGRAVLRARLAPAHRPDAA